MAEKKSSAERRREKYAAMSDEERAAFLEKNRQWREKWREKNPEKYEAQKKKAAERFVAKYQTDPDFAEKRRQYLRERYQASKAPGRSQDLELRTDEEGGTISV